MRYRFPILLGRLSVFLCLIPGQYLPPQSLPASIPLFTDTLPPQQVYAFICSDELYFWNNSILSTEGIYRDTFIDSRGSDSIVELHLKVLKAGRSEQFTTLCPDVPLIWRGNTYTQPGVYCDTIVTINGCDSLVCMHISVLDPEPVTMIGAALCPGTAYIWNEREYSTPGIYIRAFPSLSGCDSLVQLRIEVLEAIPLTRIDSIADPNLQVASEKTDTFVGYYGCDSIVLTRFIHR